MSSKNELCIFFLFFYELQEKSVENRSTRDTANAHIGSKRRQKFLDLDRNVIQISIKIEWLRDISYVSKKIHQNSWTTF